MNTPVSFETAKLLKEKGFDEKVRSMFCVEKLHEDTNMRGNYNDLNWVRTWRNSPNDDTFSAPTIAEVVMWLYEKHGVWICVYTMDKWMSNGNDREQLFDYGIKQMKLGLIDIPKKPEEFNSPTEAYLEAINYSVNNLILKP